MQAIRDGELTLLGDGVGANVAAAFAAIDRRYGGLFESGSEAPRVKDPMLPENIVSKGWGRTHFETFMRRLREARAAAEAALDAPAERASELWKVVFGSRWPSAEQVTKLAALEAREHQPGAAVVGSSGLIVGVTKPVVTSMSTRFHGEE